VKFGLSMPAYCHPEAYATFAQQLPRLDSTSALFRAAFAIALHEQPGADVDRGEAAIASLANAVNSRVHSDSAPARIAHLHDVMFEVSGFRGNAKDYYNPANSYLPDVLATRRGLPITLVLVYKCVAEQVGLKVHGINTPGHFLAMVDCPEPGILAGEGRGLMYVDPFFGGDLLTRRDVFRRIAETTGREVPDTDEFLQPASHRQWLLRMLHNLQAVFARNGRERDLFAMQELQELLAAHR
jgi:regulator of sirC expression with transglutaminase-like and TPR domain